jgi:hypothetical protein
MPCCYQIPLTCMPKHSCACKSGFVPYAGEGYALLVPAKWNPSKEFDFPGVQLR